MMNAGMLKQTVIFLEETMKKIGKEVNAEQVAVIVENHAATSALSAAAAGIFPGAGGTVALGIACASTITMYGRLAKAMRVRMNNGLIRAVASAVITDLAATAAGTVVVAAAVSFIPGVGSMAASTLSAISTFGYVYLRESSLSSCWWPWVFSGLRRCPRRRSGKRRKRSGRE